MIRASVLAAVLGGFVLPLAAQNPPAPPAPPAAPTPAPVVTPTAPTEAQQAAAAMGKNVSNDQIANAIKNSGMSQMQIQERLKAAGYDPSLANPFFGAQAGQAGQPGAAAPTGAQANSFAQALSALGILTPDASNKPEAEQETERANRERGGGGAGGVFGREIFNRASTAFDPITSGPVDPAYRLGVGDALQLVVTGQVELAYQLEMRRDGTVIIPQVGQISIAGLTLDGARTVLKTRMAQSYSGLNTGEARLDLSIARIRSNAVFVIGEVTNPGAIQVNALGTVFHALARAGGPTDRGSFRAIEVRRGGQTIRRLDLYDYLLKGDATNDIRTEQGDVIYVPLSTRNVAVTGSVRRPRIFELKQNEGFRDLLGFAGGLQASASVERVQIDRVLPAERRAPGIERVKVDVQLKGDLDSLARVPLLDNDIVTVFAIGATRRNVVTIGGEVYQPGEYELRDKMTLGQLLQRTQGMLPWALGDRVKVVRQVPMTGRTELFNVDALSDAGRNFQLEEFDAVEVLDGRTAYPSGTVSVSGAVNRGGTRAFTEKETLRDAIERAGGFTEEAQWVDLSRRRVGASYSDTTSIVYTFPAGAPFATSSAASFKLERDDRIFVRSSPGFRSQKAVTVSGEFTYGGVYAITENRDRIKDIVTRAGGSLPSAYAESFRLRREGKDVEVDFVRAMRGDAESNLLLRSGDELYIESNPRTVLVQGAVSRPTLVKYEPGRSVREYIELAGGPSERGQMHKAVVAYPAGTSKRVQRVAFFFHTSPRVVSGSTITVPAKPESTTSSNEMWTRILASTSALASLILAYSAITK
jgi:protein involved in polysaccharide export with SLBB domain